MRRTNCGGCGSTDLVEVLDLGSSPLANDYPTIGGEDLTRYPLGLFHCQTCTLIQLTYVVEDALVWGGGYACYSSASVADYHRRYAQEMMTFFPLLARQFTVEIACNDGSLLRHIKAAGCRTLGVDPAVGPAAKAAGAGLDVLVRPFGRATAAQIVEDSGRAGLIIANNVIGHVVDLLDFVDGLDVLLDDNGVAMVEFQYAPDLIVGNQFDLVYHEHRQFFSLTSLIAVLARTRLHVVEVRQNNMQGGSLRVTLARHGHPTHNVDHLLRAELWLGAPHALAGMQGRAERVKVRLRDLLWQQKITGKRVAGYGASAKATTLFHYCGIGSDLVQYMVDTTPAKQGRYMPGTYIPIISPAADSRAPDMYLLTIPNYLSAILRRESLFTQRGGQWIVPIPAPTIL